MRRASERLFLCGPPGCGKTTIGRALGQRLGLPFIDVDAAIVAHTGLRVDEIFARSGERGFRALETEQLERIIDGDAGVIALGGGTLLAPDNRSLIAANGRTIYLRASVELLERRVARQRVVRPLLAHTPVATLLHERRSLYEAADRIVDVDGKTAATVAALIAASV